MFGWFGPSYIMFALEGETLSCWRANAYLMGHCDWICCNGWSCWSLLDRCRKAQWLLVETWNLVLNMGFIYHYNHMSKGVINRLHDDYYMVTMNHHLPPYWPTVATNSIRSIVHIVKGEGTEINNTTETTTKTESNKQRQATIYNSQQANNNKLTNNMTNEEQ